MTELPNDDWSNLLFEIRTGKCVLFIGQEAYKGITKNNIQEELYEYVSNTDNNRSLIQLYNPDGFYLFKKRKYKRKIIESIKNFYNQSFPRTEKDFKKLAQIPFSMIFSLTPDNILTRTFDEMGYKYSSDFYSSTPKGSKDFESPTSSTPLIYNLLGNIEEPESLILTHSDFFNYLKSILNNGINDNLESELENAERYIFLGLPYEKWYFQLLLRILSMHLGPEKLTDIERIALKEFETPHLQEVLYTQEFKIEFITTQISEFIDTLYQKCKDDQLLKKIPDCPPVPQEQISIKKIKMLIGDNKIEQAINLLDSLYQYTYPKDNEQTKSLLIIRNRYNNLRQKELRGMINHQDKLVEHGQILDSLVDLVHITK